MPAHERMTRRCERGRLLHELDRVWTVAFATDTLHIARTHVRKLLQLAELDTLTDRSSPEALRRAVTHPGDPTWAVYGGPRNGVLIAPRLGPAFGPVIRLAACGDSTGVTRISAVDVVFFVERHWRAYADSAHRERLMVLAALGGPAAALAYLEALHA